MLESIINQGASDSWEAAEMLGALNDVVLALRRGHGLISDEELRKIAHIVVEAASNLPPRQGQAAQNRRALAVESTFRYLEQVKLSALEHH